MTDTEIDALREYLRLDPTIPSGLRWAKTSNRRTAKEGQPAGNINSRGYYKVRLHGKDYQCHRVILLLNGITPPEGCNEVDHIDRNILNNLISNLRWVDRSTNMRNRRVMGRTPWRFVHQQRGRFRSQYVHPVNKQKIHVGRYGSAYEAYCQALAHRLENHWIN